MSGPIPNNFFVAGLSAPESDAPAMKLRNSAQSPNGPGQKGKLWIPRGHVSLKAAEGLIEDMDSFRN